MHHRIPVSLTWMWLKHIWEIVGIGVLPASCLLQCPCIMGVVRGQLRMQRAAPVTKNITINELALYLPAFHVAGYFHPQTVLEPFTFCLPFSLEYHCFAMNGIYLGNK